MLKAIAFDLWETLITNTPEASVAQKLVRIERIEAILRQPREKIDHAMHEQWNRCQELYWSLDKDVSCRTQIEHLFEVMELEPLDDKSMQAIEEAYASAAIEVMPDLVGGAREVIDALRSRGYALGLISNTGRTPGSALRTILDRLDIRDAFDAMVFSNEHGECKPQRSIFEALRAGLDVPFEEMLFVGDNLYVDVYGAMRCGMQAVHFVPRQRGTAVAPPVDHDHVIEPLATIRDLRELLPVIDAFSAKDFEVSRTRRS